MSRHFEADAPPPSDGVLTLETFDRLAKALADAKPPPIDLGHFEGSLIELVEASIVAYQEVRPKAESTLWASMPFEYVMTEAQAREVCQHFGVPFQPLSGPRGRTLSIRLSWPRVELDIVVSDEIKA